MCKLSSQYLLLFLQDVSPAMLLRFLREHRSEWADSSIDAYSAAAVKATPAALSGSRVPGFGGQIILPLAHTFEHEEVSNFYFLYHFLAHFMRIMFSCNLLRPNTYCLLPFSLPHSQQFLEVLKLENSGSIQDPLMPRELFLLQVSLQCTFHILDVL